MSRVFPLMNSMFFLGLYSSRRDKRILPIINGSPQRKVIHIELGCSVPDKNNKRAIKYLRRFKEINTKAMKISIIKNSKSHTLQTSYNPSLTKSSVKIEADYNFTQSTNTPSRVYTNRNSLLKSSSKLLKSYCNPPEQPLGNMELSFSKSSNRNLSPGSPWYKRGTVKPIEQKSKFIPLITRDINKERDNSVTSIRKYRVMNARRKVI